MSASAQVLPDGVRRHLAELAATVLGELAPAQVPPALARVSAFLEYGWRLRRMAARRR